MEYSGKFPVQPSLKDDSRSIDLRATAAHIPSQGCLAFFAGINHNYEKL